MDSSNWKTLGINLGKHSYEVLIGSDIGRQILKTLQSLEYHKRSIVIITDAHIEMLYKSFLNDIFGIAPRFVMEFGEHNKSLSTVEKCYHFLIAKHIERRSVIFTVGGGVVGDLGGFVAATYMRGVDYYQIPTTLLAMVDSSIGGKTAINLESGKNLVGAFYHPKGIFMDIDFLKKLPEIEFASGMAEVIKYGLIRDRELFEELERKEVLTANSPDIIGLVARCCQIKAEIIQSDEKDKNGNRALLNLGHTFGHAIEQAGGYGNYLHGEAVSIGLVMAAELSKLLGNIQDNEIKRIKAVIQKYGLPIRLKKSIAFTQLNEVMHRDKKSEAGVLHLIALKAIGKAEEVKKIDAKWLHYLWHEVGAEG